MTANLERVALVGLILGLGLPAIAAPWVLSAVWRGIKRGHIVDAWLFGGLVVGAVSYVFLRTSKKLRFLKVLQHEFAHLLAGLVLGAAPSDFSATRGSGSTRVELRGPFVHSRRFLITIAPYVVSPLLVVPLIAEPLIRPRSGVSWGAIGFVLGISLVIPFLQIGLRQPDLRRYGLVLPIATSVWLAVALSVVAVELVRSSSVHATLMLYRRSWTMLWSWL